MRLFDLNKAELCFSPRNVPNDYLDLKVPIFDKDIAFLDPHVFYVSTAYGQIRQFDTRAKKQAVLDYQVELDNKAPLSHIRVDHQGNNLIVANSKGGVYLLDRRQLLKNQVSRKLKCGYSSVSDLQVHHSQDIVAISSLDRHVRLFDLSDGSLLRKVFTKQKVQRLLLSRETLDLDVLEEQT